MRSGTQSPPIQPRRRFRLGFVVVPVLVALLAASIIGVTGYFRLSAETIALGDVMMRAVPGKWDKRVAVHLGWMTTGLVRLGSRMFELEPEPRAALDAIHGAEVGIYELEDSEAQLKGGAVLARADQVMSRRGWDRVVGVCQSRNLVGVYMPHRGLKPEQVRCCLLVFSGRNLVVGSVKANAEPLLGLAAKRESLLLQEFAEPLRACASAGR